MPVKKKQMLKKDNCIVQDKPNRIVRPGIIISILKSLKELHKRSRTLWKRFIFSLEISISSLKIYVLRLEIYISSLKTEFLKASKLLLFGARLLLCFIRQCRYVADIHNILLHGLL